MSCSKTIPISLPFFGAEEAEAAKRTIASGWVTQGPEVAAFEKEFAASVGAPFACAVSSATAALHLTLIAAGAGPGDEVITVSHSFIATVNAIRYTGATPVLVDINPTTFNIDSERVFQAISPKTKAILCVHQLGLPCDLEKLVEIASTRGIVLIEDAACAIGSEVRIGNQFETIGKPRGDVACFSFHPRKLLTTGEGGMITTRNAEWDALFKRLRHHGMNVSDLTRHHTSQVVFESYTDQGYNYRMSDIQAAIGRVQLTRLPAILKSRRDQADRYHRLLESFPEITRPIEPPGTRANWQSYCVRLPSRSDQRSVMQHLLDEGITTRRGVMCSHREPTFKGDAFRIAEGGLLLSEQAQDQCIILPLHADLTTEDQERVIENLIRACRRTNERRVA